MRIVISRVRRMTMPRELDLQLATLARTYAGDPERSDAVIRDVYECIAASPASVWISRTSLDSMLTALARAGERRRGGERVPLFGVPFAVKDNIDVAGVPTTAACPDFAYVPEHSAPVVERLVEAGAIFVGKTNLDQFATGLVGVRSPYGACENPFDPRFITGGSSSGSAVAVATGLVTLALGTDTAGSGRVPAAFTNIVGFKPSCGALSTRGVVPACRSLDCVSLFAGSADDARSVFELAAAFDAADPLSRRCPAVALPATSIRVGVPYPSQLEFYGDDEAARLYASSRARLAELGAETVEIDFTPFTSAAELLYGGPWVAERLHVTRRLLEERPEAFDPIVREILEKARGLSALDAFHGIYRLGECRRASESEWEKMDVLLLPTAPTIFTRAEIAEEPVERNRRLGYYTNFVNLLDLCAVSVPAGFRANGLPFGVSFISKAGTDRALLSLASTFHSLEEACVGATTISVAHAGGSSRCPPAETDGASARATPRDDARLLIAVVGAHLSGEPLNHELTKRGGSFVRACRTASDYRLYAFRNAEPPKPGLIRDPHFAGSGIEVEVWSLDRAAFGTFVDAVRAPLAIGTVTLDDGTTVNGFLCEPYAIGDAVEITQYGGWRRYRKERSSSS